MAQPLFHCDQLFDFALQHFGDWDASPFGDDARDVFLVNFFLEHARALTLHLFRELGEFVFRLPDEAVTDFSYALQIAFALFGLLFNPQLLDAFFQFASARDQVLLFFPVSLKCVRFLAYLGQVTVDDGNPLLGIGIAFFLERLLFDFELCDSALELINVGGHGIDLDAQ